MTISLEEILRRLPEERRQRIERRAAEFIAEELTLREVRRLRRLTQARLARKLKIGQQGVSQIEKRTDLYLSTLRGYVESVGGELTLMIRFPDWEPLLLAGFGEIAGRDEDEFKVKKKARTPAKSKAKSKARTRRAA